MIQQFNALVPSPMLELDVHDLFLPFYFETHIPLEIQGVKVTQLEDIIETLVELLGCNPINEVNSVIKV